MTNPRHDPAAVLEGVFNAPSWSKAWRNGIYDFVHYHSMRAWQEFRKKQPSVAGLGSLDFDKAETDH